MKFFLFLIAALYLAFCHSQQSYSYANHTIEIISDSVYSESVVLKSEETTNGARIYIPYGELEAIDKIEIKYLNAKGKWKVLSSKDISDESIYSSSYYTGYRAKIFEIPETKNFEIDYTKTCKELLFIASINLEEASVVEYEIDLPDRLKMDYLLDTNLSKVVSVNKKDFAERSYYHFLKVGESKEGMTGAIPTIVYPKIYSSGWEYLNEWYYNVQRSDNSLNANDVWEITSKIGDIGKMSERDAAEAIFKLVQKEINYLDIENGIGAIVPRKSSGVYLKKQGDCKDMANLICQLCKGVGVQCDLALSSSISNERDLVFPSLSCANHVVAVATIDNEKFILDATDEHCVFALPSQHTQGRKIFKVGADSGEIIDVPVIPSNVNNSVDSIFCHINTDKSIEGGFVQTFAGLSGSHLKYVLGSESEGNFKSIYSSYLDRVWSGVKVSVEEVVEKEEIIVEGGIQLSGKLITNLGQQRLLSLNFLPFPHDIQLDPDKIENKLYATTNKRVVVYLNFEEEIKLLSDEDASFSEGPIRFDYSIEQTSSREIVISYRFVLDEIVIDESDREKFESVNDSLEKFLNKKIIYEIR